MTTSATTHPLPADLQLTPWLLLHAIRDGLLRPSDYEDLPAAADLQARPAPRSGACQRFSSRCASLLQGIGLRARSLLTRAQEWNLELPATRTREALKSRLLAGAGRNLARSAGNARPMGSATVMKSLTNTHQSTRFTAMARRHRLGFNGTSRSFLQVQVTAEGGGLERAIAMMAPTRLRRAGSKGGGTLDHYESFYWSNTPEEIDRSESAHAGGLGFDLALMESEGGAAPIDVIEGVVRVLQSGRRLDFSTTMFRSEVPMHCEHPVLRESNVALSTWMVKRDALQFDFMPQEQSRSRVLGVTIERPFATNPLFTCEGQRHKTGQFDCPDHVMGQGMALLVEFEDGDGHAHSVRFEDLDVTSGTLELDSATLRAAGIRGTLCARTLYEVHADSSGSPFSISRLELRRGGERVETLASSVSSSNGAFEGQWTLETPPGDDVELVGSVHADLRWVEVPFELTDVPIEGN